MTVEVCPACGGDLWQPMPWLELSGRAAANAVCPSCGRPLPEGGAPAADPGRDPAYDLSGWLPGERAMVTDNLAAAGIPFRWAPNHALTVPPDRQAESDPVVEQVRADLEAAVEATELEVADEEWGPGEEAFEDLSRLFDAGDRLWHDPEDTDAAADLHEAVAAMGGAPVPYGFDPTLWGAALGRARALEDLLGAGADLDTVADAAKELRDLLRDHV